MQVSKFLKAAVLASALTVSGVASATAVTTTFSGIDPNGSAPAKTSSVTFTYSAGFFDLSGFLTPTSSGFNGANSGLFLGATLLKDADELFSFPASPASASQVDFFASNLAAGTYTLKFNILRGGAYTGSYTITPVPEPESSALMLAGLGLIGLIARRKFSA